MEIDHRKNWFSACVVCTCIALAGVALLVGCSSMTWQVSTGELKSDVKAVDEQGEVIASYDASIPGFSSTFVFQPDKLAGYLLSGGKRLVNAFVGLVVPGPGP